MIIVIDNLIVLNFRDFLIYCKKCGVPFDMNNFLSVKFEFFVHEFEKIDNESIGIIKTKRNKYCIIVMFMIYYIRDYIFI